MNSGNVVKQIPEPKEIRDQLARNLRENRLLRRLLSIAEQAKRDEEAAEGPHVEVFAESAKGEFEHASDEDEALS